MKIAISSDNHLDINRVAPDSILDAQVETLTSLGVDYYVNLGDTFNDFQKTRQYFHQLQARAQGRFQVRFLAGNHDMVRGTSYEELEKLDDPLYLHHRSERLTGTNVVLMGNNGWYDYTFAPKSLGMTSDQFAHWKKAFWVDSVIEQPGTDAERMQGVLDQTQAMLTANMGKRVLFATHFVPRRDFLSSRTLANEVGAKAAAMLGSERMGKLLTANHVTWCAFGHLHHRDEASVCDGVQYFHQPVGYGTARRHEWGTQDFMTEWRATLQILTID